jgi:hypothetical protein
MITQWLDVHGETSSIIYKQEFLMFQPEEEPEYDFNQVMNWGTYV